MTAARKALLILLALDVLATVLIFNLVGISRGLAEHFILVPLAGPLVALVFSLYLIDGYRLSTDMVSAEYASLHAIAVLCALAATLLLTFVFLPTGYALQESRATIAISFLLLMPLTLWWRRLIYERAVLRRAGRHLLFLGDAADCEFFNDECRKMGGHERMVFAVPDGEPETTGAGSELALRPFSLALGEIRSGRLDVEAIILRESGSGPRPETAEQLVKLHFDGVPTYTLERFHETYWRKIPLYRINPNWLFQEGFRIAHEPVFEQLKRASDILLSAIGLLLAAPFLLVAAIAIRIEDGGPVFFNQVRVGKNRAPFRLSKLRTMRPNPDSDDLYTQYGDARVTRFGRFLRAFRLDELPQLWNVLRGEMSLIGPRAEWDRLAVEYERQIPCYNFRHLVKPGITGWAQVNYRYGADIADTRRKLEYDLYYIRYFSFTLDASIVLKTLNIMLLGKGR
jgi:exopolysaccharide biosynthesis polyprenyl glycosylphosphotransferase